MSTSRKAMLLMALMLIAATAATAATAFAGESRAAPFAAPHVTEAIYSAADATRRAAVRTQRTTRRAVAAIRISIHR